MKSSVIVCFVFEMEIVSHGVSFIIIIIIIIIIIVIIIIIRATYYIFCCRKRTWDSPDLMQFWFFFWLLFCFCFLFFVFNNPISSSISKLPIRGEIYNCTFKNTNKVSIIFFLFQKVKWVHLNPRPFLQSMVSDSLLCVMRLLFPWD